MAGRNISASHVAFGTTRVMATCAVLGEAVGIACRRCASQRVDAAGAGTGPLRPDAAVRCTRADASVLGVVDDDPANLALHCDRHGVVHAVAAWPLRCRPGTMPLDTDIAMVVPVDPELDGLRAAGRLRLATCPDGRAARSGEAAELPAAGPTSTPARSTSPPGEKRWIDVPLAWRPGPARQRDRRTAREPRRSPSTPRTTAVARDDLLRPPRSCPGRAVDRTVPSLETHPAAGRPLPSPRRDRRRTPPAKIVGGHARPYGGPQPLVLRRPRLGPDPLDRTVPGLPRWRSPKSRSSSTPTSRGPDQPPPPPHPVRVPPHPPRRLHHRGSRRHLRLAPRSHRDRQPPPKQPPRPPHPDRPHPPPPKRPRHQRRPQSTPRLPPRVRISIAPFEFVVLHPGQEGGCRRGGLGCAGEEVGEDLGWGRQAEAGWGLARAGVDAVG